MKTKNEKGQTTVEYLLLLAVIMTVMNAVMNELEEYMVTGPNSMQKKFLQGFTNAFKGQNSEFNGQYKYFVIRR